MKLTIVRGFYLCCLFFCSSVAVGRAAADVTVQNLMRGHLSLTPQEMVCTSRGIVNAYGVIRLASTRDLSKPAVKKILKTQKR